MDRREMFPDEAAVHAAHGAGTEERWLVAYLDPSLGMWLVSPKSNNRTYVEVDSALVDWETAARWVMDEKARLDEEGVEAVVVYVGENSQGGPAHRPVYLPNGSVLSGTGL